MPSKICLKPFLLFLFLTLGLFAIDGKVKVFMPSQTSIYTSQKITVSVELLSSAFSITDAKITFPASNKYIVQAPKSASYLGQEEVGGENWQMVHYDYEIYALQAGRVEIPSVHVSFTASMGYGQPKKEFVLQSDALSFEVKVPKGVQADKFVLVTDSFMLDSELKPQNKKLIIGDAVALSVIQKAKGVPDILLSPVRYDSTAYLRVYGKEPELQSGLKGEYDVSRRDSFTFVANAEGNVTLPSQERFWYNTVTQMMHVEKSPEMTFEIVPDPQIALDIQREKEIKRLRYVALSFLLILIGYKSLWPILRQYRRRQKEMFNRSEAGKFERLLNSIKGEDISAIYSAFYQWLNVASPHMSRGGFCAIIVVQPSFENVLKAVESKTVDAAYPLNKIALIEELIKLRDTLSGQKKAESYALPAKINPNSRNVY
ncbi:MAG: hypothetical protein U9O64_07940 [Campylobacterota bacterium]|nr:hypothetical protein [Campylobacterota bacterium]